MKYKAILLALLLTGCSAAPLTGSTQGQETRQEQQTALTSSARDVQALSNTNVATTENVAVQESQTASGASVKAVDIQKVHTEVLTETNNGIPIWWFIIGSLILGMFLPQPRFIRWLF